MTWTFAKLVAELPKYPPDDYNEDDVWGPSSHEEQGARLWIKQRDALKERVVLAERVIREFLKANESDLDTNEHWDKFNDAISDMETLLPELQLDKQP